VSDSVVAVISATLPAGRGLVARIVTTTRRDGDFAVSNEPGHLHPLRHTVNPGPWTWLDQVHGTEVVTVTGPGQWAGCPADAAVTRTPQCVLAVHTADCAPVVIVGEGAVGVAHAGWRGIVAGVLPATVAAIRQAGSNGPLRAYLGPCIRPGSYEFGPDELDAVVAVVGESARGVTVDGRPALDMAAAVTAALAGLVDGDVTDDGLDTSAPDFFSHRCRQDLGRQATVVWLEVAT